MSKKCSLTSHYSIRLSLPELFDLSLRAIKERTIERHVEQVVQVTVGDGIVSVIVDIGNGTHTIDHTHPDIAVHQQEITMGGRVEERLSDGVVGAVVRRAKDILHQGRHQIVVGRPPVRHDSILAIEVDHRHLHLGGGIVAVVAPESVAAVVELLGMVAREDDDRIVEQALRLYLLQDIPHKGIQVIDHIFVEVQELRRVHILAETLVMGAVPGRLERACVILRFDHAVQRIEEEEGEEWSVIVPSPTIQVLQESLRHVHVALPSVHTRRRAALILRQGEYALVQRRVQHGGTREEAHVIALLLHRSEEDRRNGLFAKILPIDARQAIEHGEDARPRPIATAVMAEEAGGALREFVDIR